MGISRIPSQRLREFRKRVEAAQERALHHHRRFELQYWGLWPPAGADAASRSTVAGGTDLPKYLHHLSVVWAIASEFYDGTLSEAERSYPIAAPLS